jgi:hypothetical protein
MTPAAYHTFLTALLEEESIVYFTPPRVQNAADHSIIVAWPGQRPMQAQQLLTENTIHEYVADLSENNYSCLLTNGGLVQIEYKWKGGAVRYHRYCYIPPPFDLGEETVRPEDMESLIDLAAGISAADLRFRSKLRFEFDELQAAVNHPRSHLHICYPECRIPVKSSIGVHSFFRFIYMHFCADRFEQSHILAHRRNDGGGDCLTAENRLDAHIFWNT